MLKRWKRALQSCLLCGVGLNPAITLASTTSSNQVQIYPSTNALPLSADFQVKVRVPGQAWQDVPVYGVPVTTGLDIDSRVKRTTGADIASSNRGSSQFDRLLTSMTSFDFSGQVEIAVTSTHSVPRSVKIRPSAEQIVPTQKDRTLYFSLSSPKNLSIELDGDTAHNLQLFASKLEDGRPSPSDPNVIYYGPGVHTVGQISIPSEKTVYLAGGSVVIGSFVMDHVHDVKILGRGILAQRSNTTIPLPADPQGASPRRGASTERHDAIRIAFSSNVLVEGIIEVPSSYTVLVGQSEGVTLRDLKSFSAGGNNDGIDIFTSKHVLIDGVFLRNSDDCIAIYGHRWNYYGDTTDVTVRNSTLWADVAHPILVGTHGDSEHPDTLSQLRFENIDILEHREPQIDYQGCMSLNAGDDNLIKDVLFENIRVDDFQMGQLLNLRVFYNRKYNTSPGRGIQDVVFRNVTYRGSHANPSIIAGYDETRTIRNVTFENLTINGVLVSDDMPGKPGFYKTGDIARIFVGEHVEGVVFRSVPSTH